MGWVHETAPRCGAIDRPRTAALRVAVVVLTLMSGVPYAAAATKRVLMDPPPVPSSGSNAPATTPGLPFWTEVEVGGPVEAVTSLPRSDRIDEKGEPVLEFVTPPPIVQWDAVTQPGAGASRPPDSHAAAGPGAGAAGRVVEVTNASVRIYNKTGAPVTGVVPLATMFPPAAGTFVYDPKILYDQHSGRFFIVVLEVGFTGGTCTSALISSRIRIAVSTTGAPNTTGAADWTFLAGSGLIPIGGVTTWADYPSIGADSDSLFVTTNQFSATCVFSGANIRVFNKAALLAGAYAFVDLTYNAALVPGVATVQPAHVYGATDNGRFYLVNRASPTTYRIYSITGDPGAPVAATALFAWAAGAFPAPTAARQCAVASPNLDTVPGRVMNAVYRNGTLWCAQTANADPDAQTEVVWHQIQTNSYPTAAPTVSQSGFLNGTGVDPWTYIPSINVNGSNDALLNFMQSSSAQCASIYAAVRLNADPPGTFQAQSLARASAGFYDSIGAGTIDRWGDYSGCAVDPTDQCFWIVNEYSASSVVGASLWGTHIAKFCSTSEGACCFGPRVCGMRTSADCASQGGSFRGVGTKCPTQNVRTAQHQVGSVVHWVDPTLDCNQITLTEGTTASTCCTAHPSPGCDQSQCMSTVCSLSPSCCSDQWSASCVALAQQRCGTLCSAGGCTPGVSYDPWMTSDDPVEPTCNTFGAPDEPAVPPSFFGPGSDPFEGTVCYHGDPLGSTPYGTFGLADTLVRRMGDPFDRCEPPLPDLRTVPIEIVALNLTSVHPITVTYFGGAFSEQWNVRIQLSDLIPSPMGNMTASKTHCNGGTWSSVLPVQPKFVFTKVIDPSQIRTFDTGQFGYPPIILQTVTGGLPWVHTVDPNFHQPDGMCTNFHPGIEDPAQSGSCDCNFNGVHDTCDLESGLSLDCNQNRVPDECDPDVDFDLLPDDCDNCPNATNPLQENVDGDRFGDACDLCPFLAERRENDHDGDRVIDVPNLDVPVADNCVCVANFDQADSNGNGIGDACDLAPPGEVVRMQFSARDAAQWTSAPLATEYRLYRGTDIDMPKVLTADVDSCRRAATAGLSTGGIVENPSVSSFWWWLVRAANTAGEGPAGAATAGPRIHDSSGACP